MRTLLSLVLALTALLALASCDVFETRKPDDPAETAEWNPFPVSPQLALANLRFAWLYAQNSTRYGELLDDAFVFQCDQQDVVEHGALAEWDGEVEQFVLSQLYSQSSSGENVIELTAVEGEEDIVEADHASMVRDYHLEIRLGDSGSPDTFEGRLALELDRGQDGLWRISLWSDSRKNNQTTSWGLMKDGFRS